MKKLILFCLLLSGLKAFSQAPVIISQPYNFLKYGIFQDSLLSNQIIPSGDSSHKVPTTAYIKKYYNGVASFNGRSGIVAPLVGDYSSFYYPLSSNPAGYFTLATPNQTVTQTPAFSHGLSVDTLGGNNGIILKNQQSIVYQKGSGGFQWFEGYSTLYNGLVFSTTGQPAWIMQNGGIIAEESGGLIVDTLAKVSQLRGLAPSTINLQTVATNGNSFTGQIQSQSFGATGTAGAGFMQLAYQSALSSTPPTGFGNISLDAVGSETIVKANGNYRKLHFTLGSNIDTYYPYLATSHLEIVHIQCLRIYHLLVAH